jgi:hypothetical protein
MKSTRLRLPEDDADASKHVGVLEIYRILLIYICCEFVGLDNKLYKMKGAYIEIQTKHTKYTLKLIQLMNFR